LHLLKGYVGELRNNYVPAQSELHPLVVNHVYGVGGRIDRRHAPHRPQSWRRHEAERLRRSRDRMTLVYLVRSAEYQFCNCGVF
jgi:hypothetical protein